MTNDQHIEIERKFLTSKTFIASYLSSFAKESFDIIQTYLRKEEGFKIQPCKINRDAAIQVRCDDECWQIKIPPEDYDEITELCTSSDEKKNLLLHGNFSVRLRIVGDVAILAIHKGISADSAFKWEYQLKVKKAKKILEFCLHEQIISKRRHLVKKWQIDVFNGANKGLIIATRKLKKSDDDFKRPDWLGEEITGHSKYNNSELAITPFSTWEE